MQVLTLLSLAAVIYLLFTIRKLTRRLQSLEDIVSGLAPAESQDASADPAPEPQPTKAATDPVQRGPWDKQAGAADVSKPEPKGKPKASKEPPRPAKSYVFTVARLRAALVWVAGHWFYIIAAVSLGLAGVFLVQYGVETGLLTPAARVLTAFGLGAALLALAEFLRRRGGDSAGDLFAYLPSTFAAGGLIAMFASGLSARVLYGLIEAGPALGLLAGIGVLAVAIGWFYGPLLAAIGLLGAFAAPFLIGGEPGNAALFYYYFAVFTLVALLVDTLKRWAWLSAIGVILGFAASAWLFVLAGEGLHVTGFAMITLIGAIIIPNRSLAPQHDGAMLTEELGLARVLRNLAGGVPDQPGATGAAPSASGFPTRLAAAVFLATSALPLWVHQVEANGFWLAAITLLMLYLLATLWLRDARALTDLALLPAVVFPVLLVSEAMDAGPVFRTWNIAAGRLAEDPAPGSVTAMMAAALLATLIAAWRSYGGVVYPLASALGAAVFAPLITILLEVFWTPADVLGADIWAYYVIALAGVMVVLAERFGRIDRDNRGRVAGFVLAALTMISLALILMLTKAALTLALAAMVLVAVVLDRRFRLPPLGLFAQIGAATALWRLVLDPGLGWAMDAPFWEFTLTYGATLALLSAALYFLTNPQWLAPELALAPDARPKTKGVLDAACWTIAAVFASVLILRLVDFWLPGKDDSHAIISLVGLAWLVSMANQLYCLKDAQAHRWVRIVLACLYALPGFGLLVLATTVMNPLFASWSASFGPYILDSLFVAYGLPALLFLALAIWFTHLPRRLLLGFASLGVGYLGLYVALEIRRVWRGDVLRVPGTTDPELYSYTVAMLLTATALLFYAFFRHSAWLRKLALTGIGLTVAKVFLIDMSGLTGLTRVFSFLVLGLGLAGLAWLDRWFGARETVHGNTAAKSSELHDPPTT